MRSISEYLRACINMNKEAIFYYNSIHESELSEAYYFQQLNKRLASHIFWYLALFGYDFEIPLATKDIIKDQPSYLPVHSPTIVDTADLILKIADLPSPFDALYAIASAKSFDV
ncbi:MAG: hypothetical protein EZS28_012493 [Streblomastix strix]|uniref:Uncharacterized protein n=1 Tax=Streblomastix strix TaxID=222440 RepID=A0A5J4WAQ4_9EUKA|nr:MAG: hypothetical protein EZS28_012493 [Streblomastix strix]